MSSLPGSRSVPARLLARATAYQVADSGAPAKSRKSAFGAAAPRTAEVMLQGSESKLAPTEIGSLLLSKAPQMSAACWMAFSRWAPSVVPGLPPTGATAVGSLKPSPAPSRLTTVIVTAPASRTTRRDRLKAWHAARWSGERMILLLPARRRRDVAG